MGRRFEMLQREMDKRFDQVDKQFEQVNNRFNDLIQFLGMLTGIFTSLVLAVLGYAWWTG